MGTQIPTKADGDQSGPSLRTLTTQSTGAASDGTRQPDGSDFFKGRRLVVWEIPFIAEDPNLVRNEEQRRFVQMYVNPQNLQINSRKLITESRTKGGYIGQYWGEELETINIQGTTGDAGIEGINVLREIYRSEQIALLNMIKRTSSNVKRRQSLMQLAASVIMWYDGQGLMGYFTDMSYTESAQKPGVFDYQLNFKATRIIGQRQNFMPWHRRPHSTAKVPFKLDEVGKGMTDGDLNMPPLADIQDGKLAFHQSDPRDQARNFGVERYADLDSFNGLDVIFSGVEAFVTQGIDNLAVGLADEILDQAERIPILGDAIDFIRDIPGVDVGIAGVITDGGRRLAGGLLNRAKGLF